MVNRADVAREAGVSEYTVSVVLNDPKYGRVGPDTRVRVQVIADRLGYRPQAAGRALRLGRTELLAYITSPQLLHQVTSYHGALVPALLSTANEAGYDLAIVGDESPAHLLARLRRALQAGRYDGVILGRPQIDDPIVTLLRETRTPFVLAGSHPDQLLYQIRRDDAGVASAVAERLIALGHRRTGFVSAGDNAQRFEYARRRREALATHLQAAGGAMVDLPDDPARALALARQQRISAVVTENDSLAVALIDEARCAGVTVPDRLSVASLYGVRTPLPSLPALASVCVDPSDAGREAVALLAQIVGRGVATASRMISRSGPDHLNGVDGSHEHEAPREVVVPSWFVNGGSIGPAPP